MIRHATYADLPRIKAIEEAAFPAILRWDEPSLYYEISRQRIWVLEYPDDGILGYVSIREREGGGRLDSVAIDPKWQKWGNGRLLVQFACDELKKMGAQYVDLDCDQTLAGFYMKCGFTISGFYLGEPVARDYMLVMRRIL